MSFIYIPFSYLMKGCLFLAGNSYVFALFFYTLAVQLIMIPIYIKQQKSQINSAKVRPMEMAIREKYKGRTDRATQQKMNMEIQEMYQKSGYNQFSGCLPLLITLPLLLIVYGIVRNPITYVSNLTDGNSAFVETYSKSAVEFYQTEKEALIKENYATEEEYNKAVSELESRQTNLGASVAKDESGNELKTESGLKVYKFDSERFGKAKSTTVEMALSKLIIDGREELNENIEKNYLDSAILADYDERGFANYADSLPNFHIFGLNILNKPDFGANAWLLVVPVLVFLTQFLAIKLNRKLVPAVPGPNGKPVGGGLFMEVGMPLLSAYFAYVWPTAMGVYWIWRTLLDMLKSFIFSKVMPIPEVTQEQIDAAKKELKGSAKSQKKKKQITIEVDEDDDSYDELVVKNGNSADRKPRRVEMLTADDDAPSKQTDSDNEAAVEKESEQDDN